MCYRVNRKQNEKKTAASFISMEGEIYDTKKYWSFPLEHRRIILKFAFGTSKDHTEICLWDTEGSYRNLPLGHRRTIQKFGFGTPKDHTEICLWDIEGSYRSLDLEHLRIIQKFGFRTPKDHTEICLWDNEGSYWNLPLGHRRIIQNFAFGTPKDHTEVCLWDTKRSNRVWGWEFLLRVASLSYVDHISSRFITNCHIFQHSLFWCEVWTCSSKTAVCEISDIKRHWFQTGGTLLCSWFILKLHLPLVEVCHSSTIRSLYLVSSNPCRHVISDTQKWHTRGTVCI